MRLSDIQESLSNDAVRQLADSSIFTGVTGLIGASAISVDEGASLNFTVATGNDATYYYWVEGVSGTVDSADFTSGWADSASRGTFSVTNSIGTFSLTLASDATTEGTETFRVKVSKASSGTGFLQSATVTINDTSLVPHTIQGSNFGYASGGRNPGLPTGPYLNTIDKFSFSVDASAIDVGDLTEARTSAAGQSSTTHGYTSSGLNPELPTGPRVNTIDKFPFSADASAIDVGDLIKVRSGAAGQSSSENGYTSGGTEPPILNTIEKFPFAADANVSDVGDLFEARFGCTGQSSSTHGYTSGGLTTVRVNTIDKFSFSVDANASDVGDLTQVRSGSAGQSSTTHGYTSGGTPPTTNTIDKFPFAADASASDVGDLIEARTSVAGQSSTTHGYTSGGQRSPVYGAAYSNIIDKFPFSADASASDVGDLTEARDFPAGQQY